MTIVNLNKEGKRYAKIGLPERRLVNTLKKMSGYASLDKVLASAGLDKKFGPIALGWIQKKKWAILDSRNKKLKILGNFDEGKDEKLLQILGKAKNAISTESLDLLIIDAIHDLKRRKLLTVNEKKKRTVKLTSLGQLTLKKKILRASEITQLTPELIIKGKWRTVQMQSYDIEAPVAKSWPGKKHPYLHFLDEVKEKLVNLGFQEMIGPIVESAFFNFDALYTPQDHPAREPSDIYYIKSPKNGNLDPYKQVVLNVKKTHENGGKTGSTGWRYKFSLKEPKRLILRGHTTCLSARTLLRRDLDIPSKYFAIARVYRPELPDKMHLQEFNQLEGIIIDENLTLKDLLGILETFALEIAEADKIKFQPDYFPFTEPSVELNAYKEGVGWIELCGSGIFRPEVTEPLGIKVPVIAWGLGIDRLFMLKAGIQNINQIFTQDLAWIRKKMVI